MNHIIEYIGREGVKTSPVATRIRQPKPGDYVRFLESDVRYPVSHHYCRIDHIDKETERTVLVDGDGSMFLVGDGHVSTSGGPFFGVPSRMLEVTGELKMSMLWNWGDNHPGGAQGVEYHIPRPVFDCRCHPKDYVVVLAQDEAQARNGGEFSRHVIPTGAVIINTYPRKDGRSYFEFDMRGVEK